MVITGPDGHFSNKLKCVKRLSPVTSTTSVSRSNNYMENIISCCHKKYCPIPAQCAMYNSPLSTTVIVGLSKKISPINRFDSATFLCCSMYRILVSYHLRTTLLSPCFHIYCWSQAFIVIQEQYSHLQELYSLNIQPQMYHSLRKPP